MTPPTTPTKSRVRIEHTTPVKTVEFEPHKIINWHKPRAKLIVKQTSAVKLLEGKLQQALLDGDMDQADKIASALADRFVTGNTQLNPQFMVEIAEQYKQTLLSQARAGKKVKGISFTVAKLQQSLGLKQR